MSNLKQKDDQQILIAHFPIQGRRMDDDNKTVVGYWTDLQYPQVGYNDKTHRHGKLRCNPHIDNHMLQVTKYKRTMNHRVFFSLDTVNKMMHAARANGNVVYDINVPDKLTQRNSFEHLDKPNPNMPDFRKKFKGVTIAFKGKLNPGFTFIYDHSKALDVSSIKPIGKSVKDILKKQDDLTFLAKIKQGYYRNHDRVCQQSFFKLAHRLNGKYPENGKSDRVVQVSRNQFDRNTFNINVYKRKGLGEYKHDPSGAIDSNSVPKENVLLSKSGLDYRSAYKALQSAYENKLFDLTKSESEQYLGPASIMFRQKTALGADMLSNVIDMPKKGKIILPGNNNYKNYARDKSEDDLEL